MVVQKKQNCRIDCRKKILNLHFFFATALSVLIPHLAFSEASIAPAASQITGTVTNSIVFSPERSEYTFNCQSKEQQLQYILNMKDSLNLHGLINIRVNIDGKQRLVPFRETGLLVRSVTGAIFTPGDVSRNAVSRLLYHRLVDSQVQLVYQEIISGATLQKYYSYGLSGKTLVIRATADTIVGATMNYVGFDFGESRIAGAPQILVLPVSPVPVVRLKDGLFLSTYVDPLRSSAGRYDITTKIVSGRAMQAANTPARLVEDASGRLPQLDITAYFTVSTRLIDVLPMPSPKENPESKIFNEAVVLDLHELPLAHRPLAPLEIIRRWESPGSNTVDIQGTFELHGGETANCEVRMIPVNSEKEKVLFSQNLEAGSKTKFGIQGSIPLAEGDQLLFVSSGPAVMTGGEIRFRARLEQNEQVFDSIDDCTNMQGINGWYYEQKRGNTRTLLLWNPKTQRWESPDTRSYQTVNSMAVRSGEVGDAFLTAEKYLSEIRALGLSKLILFLREWPDHARAVVSPMDRVQETTWGAIDSLHRLTGRETASGNLVAYVLSAGEPPQKAPQSAATLPQPTMKYRIQDVQNRITTAKQKMNFNAVLADNSAFGNAVLNTFLPETNASDEERSFRFIIHRAQDYLREIQKFNNGSWFLWGEGGPPRWDFYLGQSASAVITPMNPFYNLRWAVDEDLILGRVSASRIGFGSYRQYMDESVRGERVDPRLFPQDSYCTSTVAYARIPYLSDTFRFAAMTGQDLRRMLLETYSLLQPAARHYRNPQNTVTQIRYVTRKGQELEIEKVFDLEKPETISRVKIQYSDGTKIYANRASEPWKVEEKLIPDFAVEGDGFLALNEKEPMVSIIGRQSRRPFSAARTKDAFFLYSRDGRLLELAPLATDGMVRYWQADDPERKNWAGLNVTEAIWVDGRAPILRSNCRIDLAVQWRTSNTVDIWILQVESEDALLEFFDLPKEWFNSQSSLTLTRKNENQSELNEQIPMMPVQSEKYWGLRIPVLHAGDWYTLTFHP